MRKILFFLAALFIFLKSFGQTPSDKHLLDSLIQNDPMLKMINDFDKPSSYFRIDIGLGNKLYSGSDKAIESLQNFSHLIVTPSLGYYHKSGLGISFTGFLLKEKNKTLFNQYTITPSYAYTSGNVANVLISYTHYFEKNKYSRNTSPVQNEFYGNILFKKPWLKPGLSTGYSFGKYNEIIKVDTTITVLTQQFHINYIDTVTTKLSTFSVAASLEHSFLFFNLFSIKDGLSITPQLLLIGGMNTYNISHTSSLSNFTQFTKIRLSRIRHFQSQANNKDFELQSAGFDLDINYSIGKFYFEPDIYLNYYLPKTKDNRFTQIFNFNTGITF